MTGEGLPRFAGLIKKAEVLNPEYNAKPREEDVNLGDIPLS